MDIDTVIERRPAAVEFYFDPLCPFAYQTSRWIREVRDHADIRISWRFFSLQEVNRNDDEPHPWEVDGWNGAWSLMRVGALLRQESMDRLDQWYAAIGRSTHQDGRPAYELSVARQIVHKLGLPDNIIDRALADDGTNDAVRGDHESLVREHGGFGVPTLVFPGARALYGPVVAPAPMGKDALRLWHHVVEEVAMPHLYELKAPKTDADERHIREAFAPTFEAQESVLAQ